jgi:hypothetical protein
MNKLVAVEEDPDSQKQIPSVWRGTLSAIVDAIREGDFQLARGIPGVPALPEGDARMIKENIEDYGATLVRLPEETWNTSACQWMEGYWDVLVDLFTEEEGESDLVLSVRVRESDVDFSFDVLSVHVP